MSDFNSARNRIGFSTGALEKGNYRHALRWLLSHSVPHAELSALRLHELAPLVADLESLPLNSFTYISFHAPSSFPEEAEQSVVNLLTRVVSRGWNLIVHPDVIRKPSLWRPFGRRLLLENMDRRKPVARTADELDVYFHELPEARLCLDVAHARQLDTTLMVLTEMVHRFRSRLGEVHISELDSYCYHQLMSFSSVTDYQQLSHFFNPALPVIIESCLDGVTTGVRMNELRSAQYAMGDRHQYHRTRTQFVFSLRMSSSSPRLPLQRQLTKQSLARLRRTKVLNKLPRTNGLRPLKPARRPELPLQSAA